MSFTDLKHECGVFGIYGHAESAVFTALGLHALQHRGQEGAGIVTFEDQQVHAVRREGLVGENFNRSDVLTKLPGNSAVGHVRYSTTGASSLENVQPLYANIASGKLACAHNGNLTNTKALKSALTQSGSIFQTTSDTEVLLHLIARSQAKGFTEKLIDALKQIEGAYSLILLTPKKMIGVKDPFGIRPLVLGKKNEAYVLASETCALDIIGAEYIRDVENGEVVEISESGLRSIKPFENRSERPCIFERIYFSRPDSFIQGKTVYTYRKNLGEQLAIENNIEADVIVPVPDSGIAAALGFSQKSGIPFELGIIRNHYVGRTFIEPSQSIRRFGVKLKHSVNQSCIKGKRVILIDDSVVRGTTASKVVQMVFEAGAKEVHFGISSPPIKYPDFYGIDTPSRNELLAANHSIEEMSKIMGASSLFFLSLEGTYKAMGYESRDPEAPQFTDHCFTGDYPVGVVPEMYECV